MDHTYGATEASDKVPDQQAALETSPEIDRDTCKTSPEIVGVTCEQYSESEMEDPQLGN